MERLQKFLANGGVASRRKAEQMIQEGRVKVNGKIVTELGVKVDGERDVVEVDGKAIHCQKSFVYYLLNKPSGYVTTVADQFSRPTVTQLLTGVKERVYPVGRLDYETEGLIILTNDGDLAFKLTHPKHKVDKVYQVLIEGEVNQEALDKLAKGVLLEDGITAPAKGKFLKKWPHQTLIELRIHEGRNRQVRRMVAALGLKVKYLRRIKVGSLELGSLPLGKYRSLTETEIEELKKIEGIESSKSEK